MDGLVEMPFFSDIYRGKKVFVTGHTGFKGSWLALWLERLGAEVFGYSLAPETQPSHWKILKREHIQSEIANILNIENLKAAVKKSKPDIVFHLAAQPLVRDSYRDPLHTFNTNIMGSLNLFEACREVDSVKAIVVITTDKVYENKGSGDPYNEEDHLGGYDPYSSSKAALEIVSQSFARSFYSEGENKKLLATARAGNVIGGGDWSKERLVPDIVQMTAAGKSVEIRNPGAIRPWQHVLDPLAGYLFLGQRLLEGRSEFCGAWNFGPDSADQRSVISVISEMQKHWSEIGFSEAPSVEKMPEAEILRLDCSKAFNELQWRPVWGFSSAIEKASCWYKDFYQKEKLNTEIDLDEYCQQAIRKNLAWTR